VARRTGSRRGDVESRIRRARNLDRPLPAAFERAVVPVTGSRSSRAAQEVAFSISEDLGTELLLTHVVNREPVPIPWVFHRGPTRDERSVLADKLLAGAEERAAEAGASTRRYLREGISTVETMIEAIGTSGADLVVLGARVRNVDGQPFLGHNVETVLERCDATVVVVATPVSEHAD
jgi:nucleotide-binding universal stress UspA family protein